VGVDFILVGREKVPLRRRKDDSREKGRKQKGREKIKKA